MVFAIPEGRSELNDIQDIDSAIVSYDLWVDSCRVKTLAFAIRHAMLTTWMSWKAKIARSERPFTMVGPLASRFAA